MNKRIFFKLSLACLLSLCLVLPGTSMAAKVTTEGLQRGATIFINLCMLCHDMKYIQYQNLLALDFSQQQLDGLRRGRKLQSTLKSTMTINSAKALFGMQVPDLSLMAKARKGGSEYIYRLLSSYYNVPDGSIDNHIFPQIRMPDVLAYSVETDSKARAELDSQARDVAWFLEWAADPRASERRQLGVYVMIYLLVLTTLLYFLMKKVWRRLE